MRTGSYLTLSNNLKTCLALQFLLISLKVFVYVSNSITYLSQIAKWTCLKFWNKFAPICALVLYLTFSNNLKPCIVLQFLFICKCICLKWQFLLLFHSNCGVLVLYPPLSYKALTLPCNSCYFPCKYLYLCQIAKCICFN